MEENPARESMLVAYISLRELAELLGVDRNTVRRLMKKMRVRSVALGRCIRFPKDEVEEALAQLREDDMTSHKEVSE